MPLPTVFIGSSSEQLPTARVLKTCLSSVAQATVWDEAEFGLNDSTFGGLLKAADQYDFAVFVFDADDKVRIRHSEVRTVRDNVVFELGLFIGRMGRGRAFWISSRGADSPKLPTDLAGITHLMFDRPGVYKANRLLVALEKACELLKHEIEKLGTRGDRTIEELSGVRILCAASSQYAEPKFAEDIRNIQQNFPQGSIQSDHGISAEGLWGYFKDGQHWDLVHLAMYVDQETGDLIVPGSGSAAGSASRGIPIDGVERLIHMSGARLVVIVTCDSLALAARIARSTNIIAGYKPIQVAAALSWSAVFYHFLAQGCPLSEAFNRAQALTDPGLLLLARRDFRLNLTSDQASSQESEKSRSHKHGSQNRIRPSATPAAQRQ